MSMGGNTNIEKYGVEAVFEKDQFEKNIKSTMNSLEDFEKAIQFEGSSKGIEDLQKSFSFKIRSKPKFYVQSPKYLKH